MQLFGRKTSERTVSAPDWNRVRGHLQSGEKRIGVCKGWMIGEDIDHPCGAYLTNRALYVDIRPEAFTTAETIAIPLDTIETCGVGTSDTGSPRLTVVFVPGGANNPESAREVAVDLRCSDARNFGQRVVQLAQQ